MLPGRMNTGTAKVQATDGEALLRIARRDHDCWQRAGQWQRRRWRGDENKEVNQDREDNKKQRNTGQAGIGI